jgi:hypothetical protein
MSELVAQMSNGPTTFCDAVEHVWRRRTITVCKRVPNDEAEPENAQLERDDDYLIEEYRDR